MILQMKLGSSLACCLSSLQIETWWTFRSSLSNLGTNLAEMRLIFKLSAKMRWTVPYDSPTISQRSRIVYLGSARIASRTFATIILVDRRSSVLEVFVPKKKVLLWLMALSPTASSSIRWVSAVVFFFFFRFKQNLMQIFCSLKSVISV